MEPILAINGISKRFRLRHDLLPYDSFRERLVRLVSLTRSKETEDFWALQDITFDVLAGESVGIIGRNGAGKSTLLKILSRITPPTKGTVVARGRIASLLEVGTGFHPELTGRENVFLNGSILGMKRTEIRNKFDAIVDFSGIERFLDTPLKHYSSGMQLRLAFSVAAFLEPEILVIDEVLAVGDLEFQRKCISKMGEVTNSGRTILFVSHQLGAIRSLCKTSMYLKEGRMVAYGPTDTVLEKYVSESAAKSDTPDRPIVSTCGRIILQNPCFIDDSGNPATEYHFGDRPRIRFVLEVCEKVSGLAVGYAVRLPDGNRIFTSHSSEDPSVGMKDLDAGRYVLEADIDLPELAPGTYEVPFGIRERSGHTLLYADDRLRLSIGAALRTKAVEEGFLAHTGTWSFNTLN